MNHGTLQDRLATIRERIAQAAKRSGRQTEQITLVAVSKTHPAEAIQEALETATASLADAGIRSGCASWSKIAKISACVVAGIGVVGGTVSERRPFARRPTPHDQLETRPDRP